MLKTVPFNQPFVGGREVIGKKKWGQRKKCLLDR